MKKLTGGEICCKDITVVINSCDAYEDVLDIFFLSFNINWADCPYDVVINTETNTYPQHNAITQNFVRGSNDDDWGARLINTLSTIESEFIILLYDDYILEGRVDNREIVRALGVLKADQRNAVVYLVHTPLMMDSYGGSDHFLQINARADYRLNSAPAIWRRETLRSYTRGGDTPWAWEVFGSYRTFGDGNRFYSLSPMIPDIFPYDYSEGGAIYRGKWVRKVMERLIASHNISINLDERGVSAGVHFERRPFLWKYRFIKLGFKMIRFKMFIYFYRYLRSKFILKFVNR